ncbi:MBL fold hydrolase [Vibrio navarrensis]|uniref:ComEC/Rec2 family competence protein n=1 Tax=Vibrio TaxID=662 RepID=UPI00186753F1|nr:MULTISPECIES: MBL fold metallo-hydrolase [Vibrio]ELJ8516495.1 MBL fold metallo-hydrolase [Vibrio cholerae]MBE3657063.1 MBL fold hydrolase [Vibrio navarrensis]
MGYEIDFLGVGEESKSGDAIAIRYGNLHGHRDEQTVVVIDGGFQSSGEKLVEHITQHYGTSKVDLVINTHPDQDHINGLETVLNELEVKELWIHKPWEHNQGLADKFKDGRVTDNSIGQRLKENLEKAWSLVQLAEEKGIRVQEPFTGLADAGGGIKILGPSVEFYESLIPDFEGMPEKATAINTLDSFLEKAAASIRRFIATWGEDQINDDGVTSAKNNSSVITQLVIEGRRSVFTGDAGIQALEHAADQIEQCTSGSELRFMQIPHHGSKRNIGTTVLNRLVGEPISQGSSRHITAIASTAKNGEPKHPRKGVMNAFTHRGVKALATRGSDICHHYNAPGRTGWNAINPESYHFDYEEDVA